MAGKRLFPPRLLPELEEIYADDAGPVCAPIRLEESCRLLKESRLSIWEIAAHLQFVHAEYFCYVFRKEFGMTPLQYREQGPRRMENGSG